MNKKIVYLAKKIDAYKYPSCETYCSTNTVESCIICEMIPIQLATKIYTDHVKPLDAALEKAEADKAVLAEALGKTISILDIINKRMPCGTYYKKYEPLANDALMKASAALARVKGEALHDYQSLFLMSEK